MRLLLRNSVTFLSSQGVRSLRYALAFTPELWLMASACGWRIRSHGKAYRIENAVKLIQRELDLLLKKEHLVLKKVAVVG
jgi:hypothetical protein